MGEPLLCPIQHITRRLHNSVCSYVITVTQGHIHGHWNLRRQLILPSSQTCPFGEIEAAIKATRTKTSPEVQEVSLCGSYLVNND